VLIATPDSPFTNKCLEKALDISLLGDKKRERGTRDSLTIDEIISETAREFPDLLLVLPRTEFHWPLGDLRGLERIYLKHGPCHWLKNSFSFPLWPSEALDHLLEATPESLWAVESCWAVAAREILHGNVPLHSLERVPVPQLRNQDIVIGVPLDSMRAAETISRTWGGVAARFFGMKVVLCTCLEELQEEYKEKELFESTGVDMIIVQEPMVFVLTEQAKSKAEWKPLVMLIRLKELFPGASWYAKVDSDSFLRPLELRSTLATHDPSVSFYLGSKGSYHGLLDSPVFRQNPRFHRVEYAPGQAYVLSRAALRVVSENQKACLQLAEHEDKALALCLRQFAGTGVTPLASTYVSVTRHHPNDRGAFAIYHHMTPTEISRLAQTTQVQPDVLPLLDGGYTVIGSSRGSGKRSSLTRNSSHRFHSATLGGRADILRQDWCFYSGEPCGWSGIGRTDCLEIGCCFNPKFSSSCFLPTGSFDSEVALVTGLQGDDRAPTISAELCTSGSAPRVILSTEERLEGSTKSFVEHFILAALQTNAAQSIGKVVATFRESTAAGYKSKKGCFEVTVTSTNRVESLDNMWWWLQKIPTAVPFIVKRFDPKYLFSNILGRCEEYGSNSLLIVCMVNADMKSASWLPVGMSSRPDSTQIQKVFLAGTYIMSPGFLGSHSSKSFLMVQNDGNVVVLPGRGPDQITGEPIRILGARNDGSICDAHLHLDRSTMKLELFRRQCDQSQSTRVCASHILCGSTDFDVTRVGVDDDGGIFSVCTPRPGDRSSNASLRTAPLSVWFLGCGEKGTTSRWKRDPITSWRAIDSAYRSILGRGADNSVEGLVTQTSDGSAELSDVIRKLETRLCNSGEYKSRTKLKSFRSVPPACRSHSWWVF
jgi:hypothetical protein